MALVLVVLYLLQVTPMRVENAREVPEYEIDPSELDFTNSVNITKVHFLMFICNYDNICP